MRAIYSLLLFSAVTTAAAAASLEEQVLQILQDKCADCHAAGDEEPELSEKTSLTRLRANSEYIIAGDADKSPLFQLLTKPEGDKERMPKSSQKKPLPPLTTEELTLVRRWIAGDTATASAPRRYLSDDESAALLLEDLKQQQQVVGKKALIRYLSLANLYNEKDASGKPLYSDEVMEAFRTGVNKLLNSLSWKPQITLATPVDEAKTLLRINLDAYGLSSELWKTIALSYPYRVKKKASPLEEAETILGVLPLVRADYFVFVTSQPPLYHAALRLPGDTRSVDADLELEKTRLNVIANRELKHPDAVRAGFQVSGVSQGNRLIERLPLPKGGYYWRSYDFDPDRQSRRGGDLFHAPLGPMASGLTANADLVFSHDGGELIFSLPNGLQGYMLITARGVRLDEAPINVVTDQSRPDGRIINGISCMRCHQDGMVLTKVKDEVKAFSANLKLSPEDRATIDRLYDVEKLKKFLVADSESFMQAQKQCGYTGGDEPVGLLFYHFRDTLSARRLAAEIGVDEPQLLKFLSASDDPVVQAVAAKFLAEAPVPRPDFEGAFPHLISTLDIGTVPPVEPIAYVEFGAGRDRTKNNTGKDSGITVIAPDKVRKPIKIRTDEDPETDDAPAGPAVSVQPRGLGRPKRPVVRLSDEPAPAATPGPAPSPTAPASAPAGSGRKVVKLPPYDDKPATVAPAPAPTPPAATPPPQVPARPRVKLE